MECKMTQFRTLALARRWFAISLIVAWLSPLAGWSQVPVGPRIAANDTSGHDAQVVYEAGAVHLGTSRVFIHVYKTGLGHEHGVMGRLKQGHVVLNDNSGGGELVFDMPSFDADSDEARRYVGLTGSTDASTREQVNANMHGAGVLDTHMYPTATFKIASVTKLAELSRRGLPQYQLDGAFVLHGTTAPIGIVVDAEPRSGWLHLRGGFSILQSSYGIKPFTKAFGAVGVADRLDIWGDLWVAGERLVVQQVPSR